MKTLLLTCILVCSIAGAFAQTIEGKWKPVLLDAGVMHDYKTGTTTYSEEFKKSVTGDKDSAMIVMMLDIIAQTYDKLVLEFGKESVYKEYSNGQIKREGTWSTDEANATTTIVTKTRSGRDKTEEFYYELKGKELHVYIPTSIPGKKAKLILEPEG